MPEEVKPAPLSKEERERLYAALERGGSVRLNGVMIGTKEDLDEALGVVRRGRRAEVEGGSGGTPPPA